MNESQGYITLETPLSDSDVERLKSGDKVLLNGIVYTARDAAHKKLVEALREGKPLPFDLKGAVIYYCGPSPAPPGKVIGAAGPTTAYRMDPYTPELLKNGLKGMIGKGPRSDYVRRAMMEYKAVYFAATGGAGALLSQRIKAAKVIAYPELGPEAIRELIVENFPLIVVNDIYGRDLYEDGQRKYRRLP